jgi:zinc protease
MQATYNASVDARSEGSESTVSLMPLVEHESGQVHEQVLDNGLRVLVQEGAHGAARIGVVLVSRRFEERRSWTDGVSHWVEHMNFKGTTNIPRDKVKGIIEQFGGYWNGYTWIDQTTYTETATRDVLDRMLFIEAERMANCLYDAADCESERTVIISELQGGENDPDQLLDQELTATAFRAHPYGHPTIGWLSDLQTMTRDDLYSYYRRYYVPNNASLVIVGDVDRDDVMRRVVHHFGTIQPRDIARVAPTREPEQLGERRVTVSRQGTTAYLKVGYHAPSIQDADFFPLLVLDAVLTGAKGVNLWASFRTPAPQRSARLYRALVDGGFASAVNGGLVPTNEPFLYTISVTATGGTSLSVVEETTLAQLDAVRRHGITEQELQKAKNQLRARLGRSKATASRTSHTSSVTSKRSQAGAWCPRLAALVDAVTLQQVGEAASTRLKSTNRTIWLVRSAALN